MFWQELFMRAFDGVASHSDTAEEDKKIRKVMRSLKKSDPGLSTAERKSRAIAILKKQGSISKNYGADSQIQDKKKCKRKKK